MPTPFTLRAMTPADGPALRELMETDPDTPDMAMTTRFLVDPIQAWHALEPDVVGVVAEAAGVQGLAGAATVSFDTVQFNGATVPAAYLANLKVHHDWRGRGLGTLLARWRVATARQRFDHDGVIVTGTASTNAASLATMRKWSRQIAGPLQARMAAPRAAPPPLPRGLTVRPAEPDDVAAVADHANRFHADHNLYTPLSHAGLSAQLSATPQVYHYLVAVDADGALRAGAMCSVRARLMVDELRNVPPPLQAGGLLSTDNRIRLLEVGSLWYSEPDAARALWEYIRWAFASEVTTVSIVFDPRSPLSAVIPPEPGAMAFEIMLAVHGPELLDAERPLSNRLRG